MIATYTLTLLNADNVYYIGSTEDMWKRFNEHIRFLNSNVHHNKAFQKAWDKSQGVVEIITEEYETLALARLREQELIRKNIDDPKMLNIGLSAIGGDNLTRHPERDRIIQQITDTINAMIAGLTDEERKQRWARYGDDNGMFGKNHTEEARLKMSISRKGKYTGENSSRWGIPMSEEAKQKLSIKASEKTGEKNPFFGKVHRDDTKKRISLAKLGSIPSNASPVIINGVTYVSVTEAGRQLGIPTATVLYRIKSNNPKFVTYAFTE